jgi:uncharacterized DUF497 family protein
MNFEVGASKSAVNRDKYGIDFVQAQQLWEDKDWFEIPARTEDEPRSVLIAALEQKLWSEHLGSGVFLCPQVHNRGNKS